MTVMKKMEMSVDSIPAAEARAACESILGSDMFLNSPRMSRLLNFLVEKAISEAVRETSEYAIGIEVFDRNPARYNTGEDPIVRVQVGRLRVKLKNYYASLGSGADVEVVIPLGRYMPIFRRKHVTTIDLTQKSLFAIYPFRCLSRHEDIECFTHGLYDELTHRLYKTFGRIVVVNQSSTAEGGDDEKRAVADVRCERADHRLEGSVHVDAERIRTSVRLIDIATGCVTWSEQFNRNASLAIAHQEELASSICNALQNFLSIGNGVLREPFLFS